MTYAELKQGILTAPDTQLPALLLVVVEQAIRKGVFAEPVTRAVEKIEHEVTSRMVDEKGSK